MGVVLFGRPRLSLAVLLICVVSSVALYSSGQDRPPTRPTARAMAPPRAPAPATGTLHLLTYNVAGLPEGISQSDPVRNMPRIGSLLGAFDLVLVQEDFDYPKELRAHLRLPFRTARIKPPNWLAMSDGLSRFGRRPFDFVSRVPWKMCHGVFADGSDCLAPKGYSVATQMLAQGTRLDVYNMHFDAGDSPGDRATRAAQVRQLARAIRLHSRGRAVIVAGDTNMYPGEPALAELLEDTGLTDACRALRCPDPERIDRVLYRSSGALRLDAVRWKKPGGFVTPSGGPLSDHLPVEVDLRWSRQTLASASTATQRAPNMHPPVRGHRPAARSQ